MSSSKFLLIYDNTFKMRFSYNIILDELTLYYGVSIVNQLHLISEKDQVITLFFTTHVVSIHANIYMLSIHLNFDYSIKYLHK